MHIQSKGGWFWVKAFHGSILFFKVIYFTTNIHFFETLWVFHTQTGSEFRPVPGFYNVINQTSGNSETKSSYVSMPVIKTNSTQRVRSSQFRLVSSFNSWFSLSTLLLELGNTSKSVPSSVHTSNKIKPKLMLHRTVDFRLEVKIIDAD